MQDMSQSLHNAAASTNFWLLSSGFAHSPALQHKSCFCHSTMQTEPNKCSAELRDNLRWVISRTVVHTHTQPGHDTQLDASPIRDGCSDAVCFQPNQTNTLRVKSALTHHFVIFILVHFSTTSKPEMTVRAISNHECALSHPFTNYRLMTCWIVHFLFVEHGLLVLLQAGQGSVWTVEVPWWVNVPQAFIATSAHVSRENTVNKSVAVAAKNGWMTSVFTHTHTYTRYTSTACSEIQL